MLHAAGWGAVGSHSRSQRGPHFVNSTISQLLASPWQTPNAVWLVLSSCLPRAHTSSLHSTNSIGAFSCVGGLDSLPRGRARARPQAVLCTYRKAAGNKTYDWTGK